MSFVLRHGAEAEGLKLDKNGYANVAELVRGISYVLGRCIYNLYSENLSLSSFLLCVFHSLEFRRRLNYINVVKNLLPE